MFLAVDLAPQCGSLQRPSTEVKSEGDKRVELAVIQGHLDQPQHGSLRGFDVTSQQLLAGPLINPVREPLSLVFPDDVPVSDRRPASRADVDRRPEPLETLDMVEPFS